MAASRMMTVDKQDNRTSGDPRGVKLRGSIGIRTAVQFQSQTDAMIAGQARVCRMSDRCQKLEI